MITVNIKLEESEALEQLTDENLKDELEERGYHVVSEKFIKEDLAELVSNLKGQGLNHHSDRGEIIEALADLI